MNASYKCSSLSMSNSLLSILFTSHRFCRLRHWVRDAKKATSFAPACRGNSAGCGQWDVHLQVSLWKQEAGVGAQSAAAVELWQQWRSWGDTLAASSQLYTSDCHWIHFMHVICMHILFDDWKDDWLCSHCDGGQDNFSIYKDGSKQPECTEKVLGGGEGGHCLAFITHN